MFLVNFLKDVVYFHNNEELGWVVSQRTDFENTRWPLRPVRIKTIYGTILLQGDASVPIVELATSELEKIVTEFQLCDSNPDLVDAVLSVLETRKRKAYDVKERVAALGLQPLEQGEPIKEIPTMTTDELRQTAAEKGKSSSEALAFLYIDSKGWCVTPTGKKATIGLLGGPHEFQSSDFVQLTQLSDETLHAIVKSGVFRHYGFSLQQQIEMVLFRRSSEKLNGVDVKRLYKSKLLTQIVKELPMTVDQQEDVMVCCGGFEILYHSTQPAHWKLRSISDPRAEAVEYNVLEDVVEAIAEKIWSKPT